MDFGKLQIKVVVLANISRMYSKYQSASVWKNTKKWS